MTRILSGTIFILLLAFSISCKKSEMVAPDAVEHPWPAFETLEAEVLGTVNGGPTNATAITTGMKTLIDGGIPDTITENKELVTSIFEDIKTFDLSGTPPVEDLHYLLAELAHEAGLPHDCAAHGH